MKTRGHNESQFHGRQFAGTLAMGVGALALPSLRGQQTRNLKIGCATLAWNVSPSAAGAFELALKDISELGYWGFETDSPIIEALDADDSSASHRQISFAA